jgi:hypothetical protein
MVEMIQMKYFSTVWISSLWYGPLRQFWYQSLREGVLLPPVLQCNCRNGECSCGRLLLMERTKKLLVLWRSQLVWDWD